MRKWLRARLSRGRRGRRVLALAAIAVVAAAGLPAARGGAGPNPAEGASGENQPPPTSADKFEPVLGMPVSSMVVVGSASQQAGGQTWAYGTLGSIPATIDGASYAHQVVLLERAPLEHTQGAAWQLVALPTGPGGKPLSTGGSLPYGLGALSGRVTPGGGVIVLTGGGIVAINPGGVPKPELISEPGSSESSGEKPLADLLGKGESLPPESAPGDAGTAYAATDEPGGQTGLLIAPYEDGADESIGGPGVLHYDGKIWTRERIAWTGGAKEPLTPQTLACGPVEPGQSGGMATCWLLASYHGTTSQQNRLALFRRVASTSEPGTYSWQQVKVNDWLLGEGTPPSGVTAEPEVSTLGPVAQTLTVTAQGVWVDLEAKIDGSKTGTDMSELVIPGGGNATEATVSGHWCFGAAAPGCEHAIEEPMPTQYASFATPGTSSSQPGTRVITDAAGGGLLELYAGSFHHEAGIGGISGGTGGAAFEPSDGNQLEAGWLGVTRANAPLVHLTTSPQADQLQEQPVPFRHPLLAVAQAPGTAPGDPNASAIAVGLDGEIGRYTPGQGWSSESFYNSSGEAQTPTLRGVAWPEPNFAYAVGDNGTMWVWRAETGLWKPDPAAPYNFVGNMTGIAFDPGNPQIGYAVGKQGVLLSYGKTWEPMSAAESKHLEGELNEHLEGEKLEEQQLNFTSVAFAGGQALATYRVVIGGNTEIGGLLINEENGTGWHVDSSAAQLLAQLSPKETVLSKIAGLPDGGAVAAGPGLVIERESDSAPWRFSPEPLPEAQNVSAVAAYREAGGALGAFVSIDINPNQNPNYAAGPRGGNAFECDVAPPSGVDQPPPHLCADPLPSSGYLVRQTASGWEDMEHMAFGSTVAAAPQDEPLQPDPVFAMVVNAEGQLGLTVGGETGNSDGSGPDPEFETAAAMRFGSDATGTSTSTGTDTPAPVLTNTSVATFAVGGNAECEQACASFAHESLAPDVLLTDALQQANKIVESSPAGLRGFLYTGGRLASKLSSLSVESATRELERFSTLLGSGGASLPVYAAASPDLLAPDGGGLGLFTTKLAQFLPGVTPGSNSAYYSITCPGAADCPEKTSGGPVKVIVLDYSGEQLGETQEHWLQAELQAALNAKVPAVVMGNAELGFRAPGSSGPEVGGPKDASAVLGILCKDEASAYLFDLAGANAQTQIPCGSHRLTEIGTGTLGYTQPPNPYETDSLGSSGFLLLEVDTAEHEPDTKNVVHVRARVEPDVGQLALQATDGTLIHRSQQALFEGLARIPLSGTADLTEASGRIFYYGPEPYQPIPSECLGLNCADQVPIEYSFSSSNPEVGGFVVHETSSHNPLQVQLGANHKPIPDEARTTVGEHSLVGSGRFEENSKGESINENGEVVPAEQSGLFCAYNEGTTVISITAGGLAYSMPVTVQGGSSQYPCGTVPLKNPPLAPAPSTTPIPLIKPEAPLSQPPFVPAIHIAVPHAPAPPPHVRPRPKPHNAPVYPLVPPVAALAQLRPAILPPPPPAARPSPPSGTSSAQVTQSAYAPQKEREEEAATDLVHNFAAYESPIDGRLYLYGLPLLLLLLAFGGAKVHRIYRPEKPRLARQTVRRF